MTLAFSLDQMPLDCNLRVVGKVREPGIQGTQKTRESGNLENQGTWALLLGLPCLGGISGLCLGSVSPWVLKGWRFSGTDRLWDAVCWSFVPALLTLAPLCLLPSAHQDEFSDEYLLNPLGEVGEIKVFGSL